MPVHFKLWQRHTAADGTSRLEEIQGLDHLDATKGTLICLPGYSTTHERKRAISGWMGVAQELLGGRADTTNLVAVSYPSTENEAVNIDRFNADPLHYCSAGAKEFADTVLIPQLKSGEDVNVLAKSYGPVFFKMALNEVRRQGGGYNPDHLRLLTTGGVDRLNYARPHDSTDIYIQSTNDETIRRLNDYAEPAHVNGSGLSLTPLDERTLLAHIDIPKEVNYWKMLPSGLDFRHEADPAGHTTRLYASPSASPPAAHLMQRALLNMLTRKGSEYNIDTALEYCPPRTPLMHDIAAGTGESGFLGRLTTRFRTAKEHAKQNGQLKAVLFDWDNTLADGEAVNLTALNETFKTMAAKGYVNERTSNWDMATMRHEFTGTVPSFFDKSYGQFGAEAVQTAIEIFREYRASHRDQVILNPHAKDILRQLLSEGIRVGIVSNKDEAELLVLKNALLPEREFQQIAVVGARDSIKSKPHADPVYAAMESLGLGKDEASSVMMVGDHMKLDIAAALNAGCQPCLIGAGDKNQLFDNAKNILRGTKNDACAMVQNHDGRKILYAQDLQALAHYVESTQSRSVSARAL